MKHVLYTIIVLFYAKHNKNSDCDRLLIVARWLMHRWLKTESEDFSKKKKRFNLIWSWKETSSHLQIVTFSGFSGYIDVTFPRYSSVSLAAHAAMSVCVMFVLILRWAVSQCVYVTTLYCFSAPTFNTMSFHFILDEEVKEWKRWRKAYVLNASSSHTTHPTATLR